MTSEALDPFSSRRRPPAALHDIRLKIETGRKQCGTNFLGLSRLVAFTWMQHFSLVEMQLLSMQGSSPARTRHMKMVLRLCRTSVK